MHTLRSLPWIPALLLAGCSQSDSTMEPTPTPTGPPTIEEFSVADQDGVITHGDVTVLRWRAPGATQIAISPPVGPLGAPDNGAVSIRPFEPTTFQLTVANDQGSVSAMVSVGIQYRPGVYVDPLNGDDTNAGDRPGQTVQTLGEALSRTLAGGVIYLTAGVHTSPLAINAVQVSVYGGLDPATFFEGEPENLFQTVIRPSSGVPLSISNSPGIMEIERIVFDARNTEATAGEILDGQARITGCTFDARGSGVEPATGVNALRIEAAGTGSNVEMRRCRVFASPIVMGTSETRGVSIVQTGAQPADVLLANCFIDGGSGATTQSAGVHVDSFGAVRIGMCAINGGGGNIPAAIRVVRGGPTIGGNILFTRGAGARFGVQETTVDANPGALEGNLFISVTSPYDNFHGGNPATEADLCNPLLTIDPSQVVCDNVLVTGLSVTAILNDIPNGDFHLKPVAPGVPNPAVDRGDTWIVKFAYGNVRDDIDGDGRPSLGSLYDLGADEMN